LAAQAVDVEDLRFVAQARNWIGFILNDFWSFCAMRTEPNGHLQELRLSEAAIGGLITVGIANESDQVT